MSDFTGESLACVRGERQVFADLSFSVPPGGALLLTGPNGAGKSSLLRLMAGLLAPAAGDIRWDGTLIADDPDAHRGRLHFVSHLDAVKPALSVAENVAFSAALHDSRSATDVDAALMAFGLDHLAALPARFLSQGQRRRTALARLVASPAPLWLLDEPTLGLDRASQTRLLAVVDRHRRDGGRVVMATHAELPIDGARTLALGTAA